MSIESDFQRTQEFSERLIGQNFKCPICGINRIAKAPGDEWHHTGCRCTYAHLKETGKQIKGEAK